MEEPSLKIPVVIEATPNQRYRARELEVPKVNPWLAGAGMFRDDPLFDDWQRVMNEYRRAANEESSAP